MKKKSSHESNNKNCLLFKSPTDTLWSSAKNVSKGEPAPSSVSRTPLTSGTWWGLLPLLLECVPRWAGPPHQGRVGWRDFYCRHHPPSSTPAGLAAAALNIDDGHKFAFSFGLVLPGDHWRELLFTANRLQRRGNDFLSVFWHQGRF